MSIKNYHKIINDPVHGFITLPHRLIYDLLEHPWVQRMRRIKQLGLSELVYPGATHNRFHHALGAMHLMTIALQVIKNKGIEITHDEHEAACVAILLHDIGHGPFSHALENSIVNVHHEKISLAMMYELNTIFEGKLRLAIEIFEGSYYKQFLHQLVSSQIDLDRLDYLSRDSFYTGVNEGIVGYDRIIKMMNVVDDKLVIEEKGIYSIEKFLISRRLMYWQVYLHKSVINAEVLLHQFLNRLNLIATFDLSSAQSICTHALYNCLIVPANEAIENVIKTFTALDDNDILVTIKNATQSNDYILKTLSKALLYRTLFDFKFINNSLSSSDKAAIIQSIASTFKIEIDLAAQLVFEGSVENQAYSTLEPIFLVTKSGNLVDVVEASDNLNLHSLSQKVIKKYVMFLK